MARTRLPALDQLAWLANTHYGIQVGWFTDEGGMIAVGHHEPRRIIAAFNRHARVTANLRNFADEYWTTYAATVERLEQTWAIVLGPCVQSGYPFADIEERRFHEERCGRCAGARTGANWIEIGHHETRRGAHPVTLWRA